MKVILQDRLKKDGEARKMGNNSSLCGALEMCEIMAINFFFQICDKDGRAKCRKKWFIPDIIFIGICTVGHGHSLCCAARYREKNVSIAQRLKF